MNDEQMIARLKDALWRVETRWQDEVTDFIPRVLAHKMEPILNASGVSWSMWGGWQEAERVRIAMSMMEESIRETNFRMQLVRASGNMKYTRPTHRDYLGALMSLGFVREKIGDVIVRDNGCDFFIVDELVSYVCQSDLRVRQIPLSFSTIAICDWQPPEQRVKEKQVFLNGLRLDAVVAHGFDISRAEAAKRIIAGDVTLSYREVTNVSEAVTEDDLVVVRRLGKLRVGKMLGVSKKGKQRLLLYTYL